MNGVSLVDDEFIRDLVCCRIDQRYLRQLRGITRIELPSATGNDAISKPTGRLSRHGNTQSVSIGFVEGQLSGDCVCGAGVDENQSRREPASYRDLRKHDVA